MARTSAPGIASAGPRVMPRTSWPRAARPRHSAAPIKPAAPVTRMRASARSSNPQPAAGWRKRSRRRCIKEAPVATQGRANQRGRPRSRTPVVVAIAIGAAGRRAAAKAPLSGDRGLVFLLTPSAGRSSCARGWFRGRRRDPGARAWRSDPRRGFRLAPDRLAAARRRAPRRRAGDIARFPGSIAASGPTSSTMSR